MLSECDNKNGDHIPYNENDNSKNNHKKGDNKKHPYVKLLVDDPYNRDIILNVTKKQKGVYVWETLDGKNLYVGHSINLYNRISF